MRDQLKTELGRRGMARWTDLGSTLDRQRSEEGWRAPAEIELREDEDGQLFVWWDQLRGQARSEAVRSFGGSLGMNEVQDDGQLFSRFVELGHQEPGKEKPRDVEDPEAVLGFCERYGVFAVCQRHGQPAWRCPQRTLIDVSCESGYPRVSQLVDLSSEIRTLLRVAGRVRDGEDVDWEDCRRLLEAGLDAKHHSFETFRDDWRRTQDKYAERALVCQTVNRWLDYGDVRPRLDWDRERSNHVALSVSSLLGALARHIFLTVTGDVGVAMCDGCGRIFTPEKRKPKRGQFTWCYDCGKGSNYRVAKRIHARLSRRENQDDSDKRR